MNTAFILAANEWPPVCRQIQHLLDVAARWGHDVTALRTRFDEQCEKARPLYEQWHASATDAARTATS